jgi:hypothetical protein
MILDNNSVGLVIKSDSYSLNEEIKEPSSGLARLGEKGLLVNRKRFVSKKSYET